MKTLETALLHFATLDLNEVYVCNMNNLAKDLLDNPNFKELLDHTIGEISSRGGVSDPLMHLIRNHLLGFFMAGVSIGIEMERNPLDIA